MGKRPGAKYAAIRRLDSLMAIRESRAEAKTEAAACGESTFAYTDQRMHSFEGRENHQRVVMRFLNWCRDVHDLRDLAQIDARADESASL